MGGGDLIFDIQLMALTCFADEVFSDRWGAIFSWELISFCKLDSSLNNKKIKGDFFTISN